MNNHLFIINNHFIIINNHFIIIDNNKKLKIKYFENNGLTIK